MTKRHMLQIALDGMTDTDMSRRRYDVNGFLHVEGCHVVKEMVYPYRLRLKKPLAVTKTAQGLAFYLADHRKMYVFSLICTRTMI